MSIETKLAAWQEAGLIDAETRTRIEAFEREHAKPILLYALGGLGASTIGIGLISIVAANWDEIDKLAKLGLDLLLGLALSAGVYVAAQRDKRWVTDVMVGIHYVFVLASLALIGQVYQLGSPTHHALLAWSLSTLPMMLLLRSPWLGTVWLAGLAWTETETVVYQLERWDHRLGVSDVVIVNAALVIGVASLLGYKLLARVPWMVRNRPEISAAWTNVAWSATLWSALAGCFAFYAEMQRGDLLTWSIGVAGALLAGFAFVLRRVYPMATSEVILGLRLLLGEAWLALAAATGYVRSESPGLGACFQVALLATAAWTVLRLGRVRLFNSLTGLIGLRILVMYFEVFGSMLSTGVAMISGGVLTLLIAWVWKNKASEIASRLGRGGADHVA